MGVYESYVARKEAKYVEPTGQLAHNPTGELVKYLEHNFKINCKSFYRLN